MKSRGAKSRLAPAVPPRVRGELNELLLENVLAAVRGAGLMGSCFVVSSDPGALEAASLAGASAVRETGDSGVNGAVEKGVRAAKGAKSALVVPCDLPLLTAEGVRHLASLWRGGLDVVISPSLAFDGTNAFLFPTGRGVPLSYDRDSFWNHLGSCAGEGLSVAVSAKEEIMLDLDTPADLERLARSGSGAPPAELARRFAR